MKFETKKSLGQNFIYDTGFLDGVLNKLDLQKTDTVVEIGTGPGKLTTCLAKRVAKILTYEIDERLKPILETEFAGSENIELVFADGLKAEVAPNVSSFKLVANIPYYITTPLILKFLRDPRCTEICVLIQEEVADRIVAKPKCKEYGALSVTVQAQAECKIIKRVGRGMFRPVPNVDSAFVLIKKNGASVPCGFDEFVKKLFSQRRKMLRSIIGGNDTRRPEELSVDEIVKLCANTTK